MTDDDPDDPPPVVELLKNLRSRVVENAQDYDAANKLLRTVDFIESVHRKDQTDPSAPPDSQPVVD